MRNELPRVIGSLMAIGLASACAGHAARPAAGVVASGTIGPAGGTISVTASESTSLAGTSITVPAGALASAVTITIGASSEPVAQRGQLAAGPVVDFDPDGTLFAVPVTMTIPIAIPAGMSASGLAIEAVEGTGATRSIPVESQAAGFATFQTTTFTRFGGTVPQDVTDGGSPDGGSTTCATDSDCACGQCTNGQCQSVACNCPNIPAGACTVQGTGPCCCPTVVECPDGGGACTSDSDCDSDSFCSTTSCGGPGTCAPRPQSCDTLCASPELCGCDGHAYCNECEANAAGTSVDPQSTNCGP